MSGPADIVISEFMDEAAVAGLRADFRVDYDPTLVDDADELARRAAVSRALIVRNRTRVTAALLAGCPRLRAVGRLGVGLDNIDLEACAERGVQVLPATGANTVAVAELVLGGLLLLRRGVMLYQASAAVAAGDWPRQRLIGRELAGATLGLVGFGGIARAVAQRAAAFDMQLLTYDPLLPAGPLPGPPAVGRVETLAALLPRVDALSLHVPLTDATRNLLDAAALAAMRPDALVINTARGGIVDEAALAEALRQDRLGGALLDVFADEPLAAGSPLAAVLAERPQKLILTPHVAGITGESNARVSEVTASQVRAALQAAEN